VRNRRGVALIDALIALVILATAGVGFVALLAQTASTLRGLRDRERLVYRASSRLAAISVLPRSELLGRLGETVDDDFVLRVSQSAGGLFDVAILQPHSSRLLVRTTLYRPDTIHAAP